MPGIMHWYGNVYNCAFTTLSAKQLRIFCTRPRLPLSLGLSHLLVPRGITAARRYCGTTVSAKYVCANSLQLLDCLLAI